MISADQRAEIRRLYFAEHWKIGTIATQLGVHPDTVQRAVASARVGPRPGRPQASVLDPYVAFVDATLAQYPRLTATRLLEMIRLRGYTGSGVVLRRHVARVRPTRRREAYLHLATLAGEQAQVDWAHFGHLQVGHARRPLSCFVMVLGWSRGMYARFTLDQTLESFLRGHVAAFEAFGGAPRVVLYDNLKSVVLDRVGDHIQYHPKLLELAGHYHFAPKPCAPYRANEKGKVERAIQYLRRSFFAARCVASLEDLNAQLDAWIVQTAHARPVPGDPARRPVHDALAEERGRLLPLPAHPFACDAVRAVASGKTPYVRFDLNDYSIPHALVGRPLTLVASPATVRLLDGQAEVACHARSYDRAQRLEAEDHVRALAAQKRAAHDLRGRDRLRSVCPRADDFLAALATRGEALGGPVARLITLLDRYGAADLDHALGEARARQALSTESVAHVLDQRRRARGARPPVAVTLPDDPRVRDVRVVPHALAAYDALGTTGPEARDE